MSATRWEDARRVLAVRLDGAGDLVMTTPALRALSEGGPEPTEVTLLTSRAGAAIAPLIPGLHDVIEYEAPWMKASEQLDRGRHLAMVEELARRDFDAAVIFTVFSQNPLPAAQLCLLAGIPLRLAHCRENPYQLLTDWVPETEPHEQVRHEAQRQVDLVRTVGRQARDLHLGLRVSDGAREHIARWIAAEGLEAGPWCVLHVGATAASRRYPPAQFAEVARMLVADHGWRLVFTGAVDERPLIETVQRESGVPSLSLAGELSIAELAALIDAAPLLISNNTAPVHIAAALQTPVVDLYALTNPQHTPWMVPSRVLFHDVPCRNCYKSVCPFGHQRCLAEVQPIEVVEAALELTALQAACTAALPAYGQDVSRIGRTVSSGITVPGG